MAAAGVADRADDGSTAVRLRGVNHYFGDGDSRTQVLYGNTIDIPAGQLVIMTGPSGSGKTTLLTLVGALRSIQEGSIRVLGRELSGLSVAELVAVRRDIGFIFQLHNLFDALTAFENVKMAIQLSDCPPGERRGRCCAILERLGLGRRIDYKPRSLSGGQRQRVAVARALVNRPRLILADEPTAALDKDSGATVVTLLKEMTREVGSTVLMVTHDSRILQAADRIVNMVDGQIVSDITVGTTVELCEFMHGSLAFSHLGPTELTNVAEKMVRRWHPAGTAIIHQGDEGREFFLIAEGSVSVHVHDGTTERVVATLGRGDFFGEAALISGDPRNATVISREPVVLFTLGRDDFRQALDSSSTFKDQLLQVFFQRQ